MYHSSYDQGAYGGQEGYGAPPPAHSYSGGGYGANAADGGADWQPLGGGYSAGSYGGGAPRGRTAGAGYS